MNFEKLSKETILEKISVPASTKALSNFISWLDKECIDAEDSASLPFQLLSRSIIAVGYKLLNNQPTLETVIQTIRSGEDYALNPSEDTWAIFFESSTNSYPFGPGEGCYCIQELAGHCAPGSGCISGAGSLASIGMNGIEVMQIVTTELTSWMLETNDPIISRPQRV